jgi:hypothetical protein
MEGVEAMHPGISWGRQRTSPGSVSVLAFVPHAITLKDHYSSIEDGIRTTFTGSFAKNKAHESELMKATTAQLEAIPRPEELVLADTDREGLPESDVCRLVPPRQT